jgi:hypothetical protein
MRHFRVTASTLPREGRNAPYQLMFTGSNHVLIPAAIIIVIGMPVAPA